MPISPEQVAKLKLCTVALALESNPNVHPTIIGTGFFLSDKGHILTNRHVAKALLIASADGLAFELSPKACVIVYQFLPGQGMAELKGTVRSVMAVTGKQDAPGNVSYGGPPDLALVSSSFSPTPHLTIPDRELLPEGADVYFCGYPLGDVMFHTEHGQEQITSTLQHGIIGAHMPFAGASHPHAFVIDATGNPGNSGSPVIDPTDGGVIGVVFATRTAAFTYAVTARGYDKLVDAMMEHENSAKPAEFGQMKLGGASTQVDSAAAELKKR